MGNRWSMLLLATGAVLLWILVEGTALEGMIDLIFVLAGGFLLIRAGLLGTRRAKPSRWAGHTPLGTGLAGVGLVVLSLEQHLETLASGLWFVVVLVGTLALVVGVEIESRAARRQAVSGLERSNKR